MSPEIISALIGLIGIIVGAIPTYIVMRKKSSAEIEKLNAETDKIKAEAEKIRAELQSNIRLSSKSGNIIDYGKNIEELNITVFSGRVEYTEYRAKRLQKARKIDDATWRFHGLSKQTYSGGDNLAKQNELEIISQILKRPEVIWREVAIFSSPEHLERELRLITDPENIGYNFGVFEVNPQSSPPLTGFMIIDDEELFIAYPLKSIRLTIRHPQVVKLFSEYFEDAWQAANKIKVGNKVDFQKIQNIKDSLKQNQKTMDE